MKAGLRFGVLMVVAGMFLGAPALAQDSTQSTTNTPATDAIGPRELQGFSLPGTVTRAAEQPVARQPAQSERPAPPSRTATASSQERSSAPAASRTQPVREVAAAAPAARSARDGPSRAQTQAQTLPSVSSVTTKLPPVDSVTSTEAETFPDETQAAPLVAPEGGLPVWPWLLAAIALGAGGAFLFWRNRERHSYAGGPQIDAFASPEPTPRRPAHAPAPRAAPKPAQSSTAGVVTTRLRPWIDLQFEAVNCIVEEDRVLVEFELELFNSGSAPARDLLIEAVMMNASPLQDEEAKGFFGRTSGEGGRMPSIGPLKRVSMRRQVGLAMNQVRVLDAGGRKVFVPLIAFNVIYNWSGGVGQTSAVYLIGRDNKGDKLAPFRVDLGRRIFRNVAARLLPTAVRN
jgi:hypothetical protein